MWDSKVLDFESSSRNTEGQGEGESGLNDEAVNECAQSRDVRVGGLGA